MIRKFLILTFLLLLLVTSSSCTATDYRVSPDKQKINETEASTVEKPISSEEKSELQKKSEIALVTEVIDGDTIVVLLNGKKERVRLIGIDTPEAGRPYFEEAKNKTKELVLGKKVRLEKDVSERDKYGRLLRYVYVGNVFINAELVKQGYAMVYTFPPDVKYADYFLKLQKEAREKELGLWAPVSKSSSENKTKSKVQYVASKNREPFHYPWCRWAKKISPYNLQTFSSREEALRAGHRPCKICNP